MSGLTLAQRLRVTAAVKGARLSISGDYARILARRLDEADSILARIDQLEIRLDELEERIAGLQRGERYLFWATYAAVILLGIGWLS